jgi:acetyl-CoA carboxylase carboxyl transferase subunit alpha
VRRRDIEAGAVFGTLAGCRWSPLRDHESELPGFEQPIAELEVKIEELQLVGSDAELNLSKEIDELRAKSAKLTEKIFSNLSPGRWSVARHPLRPYTLDYIPRIFSEFDELHGDRHFGDDKAIVGGIARLDGRP